MILKIACAKISEFNDKEVCKKVIFEETNQILIHFFLSVNSFRKFHEMFQTLFLFFKLFFRSHIQSVDINLVYMEYINENCQWLIQNEILKKIAVTESRSWPRVCIRTDETVEHALFPTSPALIDISLISPISNLNKVCSTNPGT